jgi:hypothetical protein
MFPVRRGWRLQLQFGSIGEIRYRYRHEKGQIEKRKR